MTILFLFTTEACHLCEQAQAIIEPLLMDAGFELQLVEISERDDWIEQYGIRIPVIKREDREADLGWPFSEKQVKEYLITDSSPS